MIDFLICLVISVMLGCGMAIVIVEKGKEWPVRPWRIRMQLVLRKIHYKLPKMLKCTTCSSFWFTGCADIVLFIVSGGTYFFWPFSGIICAGIMWTMIEILNSIDKDPNINVFIDKGDHDEN